MLHLYFCSIPSCCNIENWWKEEEEKGFDMSKASKKKMSLNYVMGDWIRHKRNNLKEKDK